jgi:hypothetical protein
MKTWWQRRDGCGEITPHAGLVSIGSLGIPEAVCNLCDHRQPRVVGDEIAADTTVTCAGRRHRRIGFKRSRHRRRSRCRPPRPACCALRGAGESVNPRETGHLHWTPAK